MMHELTTTDRFELETAEQIGYKEIDDVTINRWTKKGDRLYINNLVPEDIYVDLETGDVHGTTDDATAELDGDELTVTIEIDGIASSVTKVAVITAIGVETSDEDADEEPVMMTDGGRDTEETPADHVDDDTIRAAIHEHDDPDHADALTVAEVRELLAFAQDGAEVMWDEWMDIVEDGPFELVRETPTMLILSTGEYRKYGEELEPYDGDVTVDDVALDVISAIHHRIAERETDYDWGYSYPYVIRKPDGMDAGQRYVEAVVNGLQLRGLSPAQAWAYYGVEVRGSSRNEWGSRCGHSDHSAVSQAVRKAEEKLP